MTEEITGALHASLSAALSYLKSHPAPSLASPPNLPKRASVALVLRVQPNPARPPPHDEELANSIDDFFASEWVRHGEPEVLFIKRAARKGDRWTSHVAFPGGKRDAKDEDDFEAAARETFEEVGLNLKKHGVSCGKLPDRVVSTLWDTVPLMVLCPFVFLITSPNSPALLLQPSEVASAHWVPLRLLLEPSFRTVETCDVTDRLARRPGSFARMLLRLSLGCMEFSAIRLWPSQSVYSTFGGDFLAPTRTGRWESPLILWGLTLAVLGDFVDTMPSQHSQLGLWEWPTFTAYDVRAVIRLMTRGLRRRILQKAKAESVATMRMLVGDMDVSESTVLVRGEGGEIAVTEEETKRRISALLEGYHDVVRKAVWITLASRAIVGTMIGASVIWRLRR